MTLSPPTVPNRADAVRALSARHPWRWVAIAVVALLAGAIIWSMVSNPNFQWEVIGQNLFSPPILAGIGRTLLLTAICMTIGIVLGTVIAIAGLSPNPVLSGSAWVYLWIFRGTPVLVQLVLWFNFAALYPLIFGVDTNTLITPFLAAILGLSLNETAYMAEIVRSGVLSVDEGQTEAGLSIGMTKMRTMRRIVLPQAVRVVIPTTGNQLIGLLKYTSLVSVLAVPDLLYSAELVYQRTYQVIPLLLVAAIWYLAITSALMVGQYYLELHFAKGGVRSQPLTPLQRIRAAISRGRSAAPNSLEEVAR